MASPDVMDYAPVEQDLLNVAETIGLTNRKTSAKVGHMSVKPKQATIPVVAAPIPPVETRLETAYNQFTNTAKGTPEHDRAWDDLTDALFANAK